MKSKLAALCTYMKGKVAVDTLDEYTYISTENMIPNKGGIERASSLPSTQYTQAFDSGDVLVSNIRPYFKKIWMAEYSGGCSNDVLVFRASKGCDPTFLYYVLANNSFFDYATATSKGTKMPRGDKTAIMQYEVPAFDIATQQRIGSLLKGIDTRIVTNKKINDNLQQQAKLLYEEMFLNNPDADMVSGTLSDIATITMGQSPSGSSYNEESVGEVFYQGRAEFGFRFPTRRLFTTEPKRMAEPGDVLLSVRAPVGDLNVAYEKCCIGRGLGAIHSKTGDSSFMLYTMFALKPQLDVFNGEGTIFGSINRDGLSNLPVNIPSAEEIAKFEATVRLMDNLIRTNYEEICRLQSIRDSLLPKLMSGEIDVSDIQL